MRFSLPSHELDEVAETDALLDLDDGKDDEVVFRVLCTLSKALAVRDTGASKKNVMVFHETMGLHQAQGSWTREEEYR